MTRQPPRRRRVVGLGTCVDLFLVDRQIAGYRARGVESYRDVLWSMLDVLGTDYDPRALDHAALREVLASWLHCSNTTRAGRVSVLRAFGAWLFEEGYTERDPAERLVRPRKEVPVRHRPAAGDLERLLRACQNEYEAVPVAVLGMTGVRLSELRALRWRDVDLARGVLYVEDGKGGKGRAVPVPPALVEILRDARARRAEHAQAEDAHYVACRHDSRAMPRGGRREQTWPDEPCGERWPREVIRRAAKKAGLGSAARLAPHAMRRGYADAYLRAHPGDIVGLQALLGHASISTTREYLAGVELEELQKRVQSVAFVTPRGADFVTRYVSAAPATENPCNPQEEATSGIEPLPPLGSTPDATVTEPPAGLVTPSSSGFVTPEDEGEQAPGVRPE